MQPSQIELPRHVRIEDDFDLEKIRLSGQCFRISRLSDMREGDVYRVIAGEHVLYIRQAGKDRFCISCDIDTWSGFWHGYFDLDRNYAEIRHACKGKSKFLDAAMDFGRGLRVLKQDPWEMLITFIISQRKNIPAISKAVETISDRFGREIAGANETLHAFPTPSELASASEDELRECSLGYRAPYIFDTTRLVLSGELDLDAIAELPDAELFEELRRARGVGAKVANCVSLFGYARKSQVPVDVWIARAIEDECAGSEPFSQFGEDAGIMQQYAFYYMTNRGKIAS